MKVAMMQPTFLPWQGFFALISACDRFVLGDDYHYSAGSFHRAIAFFATWTKWPGSLSPCKKNAPRDCR